MTRYIFFHFSLYELGAISYQLIHYDNKLSLPFDSQNYPTMDRNLV